MMDDDLRRLFAAATPVPAGLAADARARAVLARVRMLPQPVRVHPWFAAALAASLAFGILSGGFAVHHGYAADHDDSGLVLFEDDT